MTRPSPSGRIRVAFVAPALISGGAERQMLYLAGALPRSEFDIRFMLLSERGALADEAESLGVRVDVLGLDRSTCVPFRPACLKRAADAFMTYLKLTRGLEIVDAWLVPAYTFAGLAQPFSRVPVLVAGRRSLVDVARTRRWYRELAGSIAMRSVDAIVANSQAAADQAVKHEGIDPRRVHVIHNAVVPVGGGDEARQALRNEWGFSDHHVVVGCIGALKPGKGHQMLLDVAAALRGQHPGLRFVFIGDGPLKDRLFDEVSSRGLGDIVKLHTHERDARRCYAALEIVAQASDSEGMPNAVLEAASAARAIIATDVGGTREIITSEESGILVPKDGQSQMAAGIERLAADEGLRAELGLSAAKRSSAFSVERLASQTATLYRQLLDGAHPPHVRP